MSIKEKIVNSKPVQYVVNSKAFAKAVDVAGVASVSACTLMTSVSAAEGTVIDPGTVDTATIISNAQPFITAALPIICIIGGVKLGFRFLRSAMH